MMSPVKELLAANKGRSGDYQIRLLCGEAAQYIELLEQLVGGGVHAQVEALTDLAAAQNRIAFLHKQIIIEQTERQSLEGRYAIMEARYKQVEERWHKLMERKNLNLQASNRITNWDMRGRS